MSCCDESTARLPSADVSRRSVFKGAAMIASVLPGAKAAGAHFAARRHAHAVRRVGQGQLEEVIRHTNYEL